MTSTLYSQPLLSHSPPAIPLLSTVSRERLSTVCEKMNKSKIPFDTTKSGIDQINPYEFQVAGHDSILRAVDGRLYKPLKKRELWFYQSLSESHYLRPFLPQFLGCVPFTRKELKQLLEPNFSSLCHSNNSEHEGDNKQLTSSYLSHTTHWNPWALQMHSARLLKFNEPKYDFIVLQDLTHGYKHPTILDVKIGVRQYGDDATAEKRESQTKKSLSTTSATLGFRICGMQVWETSQRYRHLHKYEGRLMTRDTAQETLKNFFYNGTRERREILISAIEQLQSLLVTLENHQSQYRFYSTSLLLLYEGDEDLSLDPKIQIKLIDFANTFPRQEYQDDDSCFIMGIRNLTEMLLWIRDS